MDQARHVGKPNRGVTLLKKKDTQRSILDTLKFGDKSPIVIQVNPDEQRLFVLQNTPSQFLAIAWDLDTSGKGYWRIQPIGVKHEKIITKQYRPGETGPAFYGEISVVGAGRNDLYTSFGYEDPDNQDHEGNLKNKAREIIIRPKREN